MPDIVLCSPACRARETSEALGLPHAVFEGELYGATAAELSLRVAALPATIASAMVIGHNPGLEQLGHELGAEGPMRTAELWMFELDAWDTGGSRLVRSLLAR